MTEVNVDKMICDFERSEYVDKHEEKKQLHDAVDKPKVQIKLGRPMHGIEKAFDRIFKEPEIEIKDTTDLKKGLWTVASLPMKNMDKREKLKESLAKNKFMNDYADKRIIPSALTKINDDLKAMVCYSYLFLDAYN